MGWFGAGGQAAGQAPERPQLGSSGEKRGQYPCAKCADYGKIAVVKSGHTCPYKERGAPPKQNGKHFNSKEWLIAQGVKL